MDTHNFVPGIQHEIERKNVFEDVISLYSDKYKHVVCENYSWIKFKGEKALDAGGVSKDLFSAFFEEVYVRLFDGTYMLHPAMNPSIDISVFGTVGAVISHAFLTTGFLPDRISFPCLAAVLLGPTVASKISDKLLQSSFIESLSAHEANIMLSASQQTVSFSAALEADVIHVLSSYGCRRLPNPGNLEELTVQCARYVFLTMPSSALALMHSGIPQLHLPFWESYSLEEFHTLFISLAVSVQKVLNLLIEPEFDNPEQEKVWTYLCRLIGMMSHSELRGFLRFVTGSTFITVPTITVTFNRLSGLQRRPLSHTCSATLELSTKYTTATEFCSEFRSVLQSEGGWAMDGI